MAFVLMDLVIIAIKSTWYDLKVSKLLRLNFSNKTIFLDFLSKSYKVTNLV